MFKYKTVMPEHFSQVEQRVEDYKQEIKDIEETIEPYNEYR